jgi:hypothetical protein
MSHLQVQTRYQSYKGGKISTTKQPKDKLTKNDFYFFFANSLRKELAELSKTLTNSEKIKHIPEPLIGMIERTYGRAMQATHPPFFRGPRVSRKFFTYVDSLDAWTTTHKTRVSEDAESPIDGKLKQTLSQLFVAIEHYIKQCRMTQESYKPGCRPPVAPTNWAVKNLVKILIDEYKPTGKKRFPPYKSLCKRLEQIDPNLSLSERTYRLYKRQISDGTFEHRIQRKRQQVT